ncbi:MAG: SelL-related redox protein [Verrucomicrobiales bacterium]
MPSIDPPGSESLPDEATLLAQASTSVGRSVAELSQERPVLAVMLRHSGCTFCRQAMSDLRAARASIEASGTTIVLVHMSEAAAFAAFATEYGLDDLPAVSDPDRRLYRGLGLRRGRLSQLLGPSVWWRGFLSWKAGHAAGTLTGDVKQMPGVFLIHHGRVVRRFIHATAAERPDYAGLCDVPS